MNRITLRGRKITIAVNEIENNSASVQIEYEGGGQFSFFSRTK